eukprot:TRINITY_DN6482_c0_g1_i3.p1 TRINITY_DN6482_c0_g1~~TRINITY_DN6482_c0_g1_i3.p1  ORF type:complete len:425 (-),score=56.99 TRINITY_DN6482_c0_g1_i3:36-1310(-)
MVIAAPQAIDTSQSSSDSEDHNLTSDSSSSSSGTEGLDASCTLNGNGDKHHDCRGSIDDTHRFRFTARVEEEPRNKIYCIAWCDVAPQYECYFATVCGARATVYESLPLTASNTEAEKAGGQNALAIDVVQSYSDEDTEEELYACAWSYEQDNGAPLLAVAGLRGVIKIISCRQRRLIAALVGHGNSVNELKFHPVDGGLLLSASKDESIRLWNMRTNVCVAIFAGDGGHRDEVISIDIRAAGDMFLSGGMDNTVKVWALHSEEMQAAMRESYSRPHAGNGRPFKTLYEQFPLFSTAKVHNNYVDCARWVGSLIMSKSVVDLTLWRPDPARGKDAVMVLNQYPLLDTELWFMRFGFSADLHFMAVGSSSGRVDVWDVDSLPPKTVASLYTPKCKDTVRMAAFSPSGSTLLVCCDDASLWRWDMS